MKARIATTWLDGCSGCHMSLLDMDEGLIDLAGKIDLVYSPLVDVKEFPENVDVTLVEGAVNNTDEVEKIRHIRERTHILVSLGDCAVTCNVPSMRNAWKRDQVLQRAYIENAQHDPQVPSEVVPPLLARAHAIHEIVPVDVFLPGCPPPTNAIVFALGELLEGRLPDLSALTRFGR
jgi:NAD-reducing hydrogenase small subunit